MACIFLIPVFSSCGPQRDDARRSLGLFNDTITRIAVRDSRDRTVDILDSGEIGFFLSQLNFLTPRVEKNIRNEYDLTLYHAWDGISGGWHVTTLRMGKECIGVLVPATDGVTRWYFRNDSLYTFIAHKFSLIP